MRIFVAGASGAVGRPLVRRLVAAGHEVTGMTRSAERAQAIRAARAEAIVCDVFAAEALAEAVAAARPEVVVHELTALPAQLDVRREDVYEANNRVRIEGTRNLVLAARAAGARRLVAQSVCFLYAPVGEMVSSEDSPTLGSDAPGGFGTAVAAALDLERQVIAADGVDGLVLRYGFFYGPGTHYASDGYQADQVRRRRFPIVGDGGGVFSFVHVDDAADATAAACERGEPGIYNVCDDDPARLRDWLPVYASAVGAKPPRRIPAWLARLVAGKPLTAMLTSLRGASNAKAKRELGWQPAYPSWRRGFGEALG